MSKSRASKMNGYRSMVSRQKNDVFKFKPKKKSINVNIKMYIFDHLKMYRFAYSSS